MIFDADLVFCELPEEPELEAAWRSVGTGVDPDAIRLSRRGAPILLAAAFGALAGDADDFLVRIEILYAEEVANAQF